MCEEGFQMKGSEVLSQGGDGKVEKREMGQENLKVELPDLPTVHLFPWGRGKNPTTQCSF